MELKEIIKYVKESAESDLVEVDADTILECATRIYISGRISEERRGIPPRTDKDLDNKPTQKQINFLKSKNYNIPLNMTFEEAKTVIGKLINKEQTKKVKEEIY